MICEPACCPTRLTLENQFSGYVRTVKFLHCYSFGQFPLIYSQRASFPLKGRTYFRSVLLLLFLGLFTELEHCPTHVLLSFLVQKVQNLEISMPAQCHYFDELLLTMIKRENFFCSTAVVLYQCLFRYVRNRHFRGVLLS